MVIYELTKHAQSRLDERNDISLEWVERTLLNPQRVESDERDPKLIHALASIPEYDNRVLRVVYNPTENPWKIVTVHFDRRMKGKL